MKALIVSIESFQKGEVPEEVMQYINANPDLFIVLDESSKIKTNQPCIATKKSKRTQAVLKLNRFGERCILTGTFMSKSPVNAYDQMNFLCPSFFPETIFAFAEKYCIRRNLPAKRNARVNISQDDYNTIHTRLKKAEKDPVKLLNAMESIHRYYGVSYDDCRYIMAHEKYSPFKNIKELWSRIGDVCMKVDRNYTVDMPPKVYKKMAVDLTQEQKKLYLQLQNQYCTDHITVDNGLELYLRFQDVCNGYEPVEDEEENVSLVPLKSNPKLEMLMEVVEGIGNEQCVVWCSRSQLLYDAVYILENNGYNCGVYDGKIGQKERELFEKKFKDKEIQIMLVNQSSGSYGLNSLKDADYAIYLCNDYSVEHREQSEERIYRGIVDRNKYIIDIVCHGTCEEKVGEALRLGKELVTSGEMDTSIFMLTEEE